MKQRNSAVDQKGPLLHAIANFLDANGFSRTLQHFLSEAPLDENGMKECSLDLEEMYCKYYEMCMKENTNVGSPKENGNDPVHEEVATSKDKNEDRKKVNTVSNTPDGVEQCKPELLSRDSEEILKDISDSQTENESEDKEKKKNKSNDANQTSETIADENLLDGYTEVEKNKNESSGGDDNRVVSLENASDTVLKEGFKVTDVDATDNENKSSKKRTRLDSEDKVSEHRKSREDEIAERSSGQKSIKKQCIGPSQVGTEMSYGAKAQEILDQDSEGIWKLLMQNRERAFRRNRQRHFMMMAACSHILEMGEEESDSDDSESDESA